MLVFSMPALVSNLRYRDHHHKGHTMKTILQRLACALALFTLTGAAIAAPHDDDHSHKRRVVYVDAGRHHGQPQWERDRDWQRRHNSERYDRAYYPQRYPAYYRNAPRYDARWQRGHRYHGPSYVVRDYRHYHLRTPPRGQHWVRADDRYLLVAVATGIIMDIATR